MPHIDRQPLIIGIDPGTTAAIAFTDAHGEPLKIKSSRKYSKEKLIREIREAGDPLIMATDKSNLPSTLEDVATKFNCKVNTPNEDLSKQEKTNLTNPYKNLIDNEHEKDALASALKAYKTHSKTLRKIEKRNPDKYLEVVREKFLGTKKFKKTSEQKENKKEKRTAKGNREKDKTIENLKTKVKELEDGRRYREEEIKRLEDEIDRLKENQGITQKEALLQSTINRFKREKERLEARFERFIDAYEEGKIKKMSKDRLKRENMTQDPEAYEKLREKGKEAHLINILYEGNEKIYYTEIKSCEPRENPVKDVLNNYKDKRKTG